MGKRIYVKGKRTHAAGEGFDELEKKNRYMVRVDLVSLKTIKKRDIAGTTEFYFKTGSLPHVNRVPAKGTVNLMINQSFTTQERINLWTEFLQLKKGDKRIYKLPVKLYDRDLDKDDLIAKIELEIKLGAPGDYIMLESKDGKTEAKLYVAGVETRY